MTDTRFPHLFAPLRIGPVEVRNRIVSSGHDTVMAVDGVPSDQMVAYQEARATTGFLTEWERSHPARGR